MVACHNQFIREENCAKSQIDTEGTFIACANDGMALALLKGAGDAFFKAAAGSREAPPFWLSLSDENTLIFHGEGYCQQSMSLETLPEVPLAWLLEFPVFQEMLKKGLEQWQRKRVSERVLEKGKELLVSHMVGQSLVYSLVHTRVGDYPRALGFTLDWQRQDHAYWWNRTLRFYSSLFSIGSTSALCLETALLHPRVQSVLPGDTYRSKLALRFIADLLQFGPSASSSIPTLCDFLFYQHPAWSYEKAMGLRAAIAMLEMARDPSTSTWYLTVGLFILPQIPDWLESLGIPVTRCISHALKMLENFFLSFSLLLSSLEEDPQRLEAKEKVLQAADQRVEEGKKRMVSVLNKGVGFFSKAPKTEANDAEFTSSRSAHTPNR